MAGVTQQLRTMVIPAVVKPPSAVTPVDMARQPHAVAPLHIPSLDGLRAVSFLIVFVAHSHITLRVPGGFGVTVFFFLSGFLITTLMRLERQSTGTVDIGHFYLRRVLRILPPFYAILALGVALTALDVLPGELKLSAMLAQVFHIANYWFIFNGSDGVPAGTVPYWSLAVEEHFYLGFPLLYVVLTQYLGRRSQAAALWSLCAVICAWRCYLVISGGVAEERTYMGSDTRFDSILFGCALAVGLNPVIDPPLGQDWVWKWISTPAALLALAFTFWYQEPWFRETTRYSLQGLALTPLFVTAIRFPEWLPCRVLNARPVAFFGVLSYSLYLAHQMALVVVETWFASLTGYAAAAVALAISLSVALLIYYGIEKPSARLRKRLAHGSRVKRSSDVAAPQIVDEALACSSR